MFSTNVFGLLSLACWTFAWIQHKLCYVSCQSIRWKRMYGKHINIAVYYRFERKERKHCQFVRERVREKYRQTEWDKSVRWCTENGQHENHTEIHMNLNKKIRLRTFKPYQMVDGNEIRKLKSVSWLIQSR